MAVRLMASFQSRSKRLRRAIRDLEAASAHPVYPLLFDPQTSGGLLISLPEPDCGRLLAALGSRGVEGAARIGTITNPGPGRLGVRP